jgi:hypothetical protein
MLVLVDLLRIFLTHLALFWSSRHSYISALNFFTSTSKSTWQRFPRLIRILSVFVRAPSNFVANNETLQQASAGPSTSGWDRGHPLHPSLTPLKLSCSRRGPISLSFCMHRSLHGRTELVRPKKQSLHWRVKFFK